MANPKIKFKRSAVASKRPSLDNLELGELALNTYDGKLFTRQDTSGVGIATTVTMLNPWDEAYGENKISYGGTVTTGDINVEDLSGENIFITGVTTSIGGFILRNPSEDNYSRNETPPDYSDNNGEPTMDEDPISAGIYADGSASFSGIVTASGGFVGNITGDLTGTSDTANRLTNARSIALTGDVLGSPTFFDGSGNISIAATIQPNSVALGDDTTGNYVATIAGTANEISVSGSGSETAAVTLSLPDAVTILDLSVTGANIGSGLTVSGTTNVGFLTASNIYSSGVVTATTFLGNLTGNVTGNVTGDVTSTATTATNAEGLTGSPNIVVNSITAAQLDVNGISTFHSKVHLLDNKVLHLGGAEGESGDLQIYHDTSNSYIKDAGTGALKILGGNTTFKNLADNKTSATFNVASSVDLYYNNSQKFETTNEGVLVTGIVTATSFHGSGANLTGITTLIQAGTNVTVTTSNGITTISAGDQDSQTLNSVLGYGNTSDLGMSVGVVTATRVSISGTSEFQNDIYVDQIRRYSGNSTTTKIQLNANQIRFFAGNGTTPKLSLNGTVGINTNTIVTGVLTATSFSGDGSTLSNIPTSIVAGDNISISGGTGAVTITGLANTSNVSADSLVVSGISTFAGITTADTSGVQVTGVVTATSFVGDGSGLTNVGMDTSIINSTQIQSGIITATSQFYPPTLTTTERDALTVSTGAFIYNTTENRLQVYLGSTWASLTVDIDPYSIMNM